MRQATRPQVRNDSESTATWLPSIYLVASPKDNSFLVALAFEEPSELTSIGQSRSHRLYRLDEVAAGQRDHSQSRYLRPDTTGGFPSRVRNGWLDAYHVSMKDGASFRLGRGSTQKSGFPAVS